MSDWIALFPVGSCRTWGSGEIGMTGAVGLPCLAWRLRVATRCHRGRGRDLVGGCDWMPFLGWRPHVTTSCHGGLRRDWVDGRDWIVLALVGGPTSRPNTTGGAGAIGSMGAIGSLFPGWSPHVATKRHWGRGRDLVNGSDWVALSWLAAFRRNQLPQVAWARLGRWMRLDRPVWVGGPTSQPTATGGLRREWATSVGCMKWATAR